MVVQSPQKMRRGSDFVRFLTNCVGKSTLTESKVTKALSRWFYNGSGRKYLGRIGDYTGYDPRQGLIRITKPTDRKQFARWNPMWDHICQDDRGITFDNVTKLVPFVAVDLDRHDGSIPGGGHARLVVEVGRYLRRAVPHLKWIVEVNPANGSSKYFGFARSGRLLRAVESQQIAHQIHDALVENGLCHAGKVEVFPHNCKAVRLPLHLRKITIVDQGMLL